MHLNNISIVNYKNLGEVNIDLSSKLNCFIGDNGAGKTNLLDAVYYLSFCKSFFNSIDQMNIRHEEEFYMLKGKYNRQDSDELISCGLYLGQKKQFKRNSKIYSRLSDHIGFIPLVMITPSDVNLILGGSDERRKFMDGVISQYDHSYLKSLINYNKALAQRNNLLKQFAVNHYFDEEALSIWDVQLVEYGTRIHQKRKAFVERLIPVFRNYYSHISKGNEQVGLVYQSDFHENNYDYSLKESLPRDRILQYTTVGVHKEDLLLNIDKFPIKRFGSQGQKKTYLVSLKLAQFEFIKEVAGLKPILLLDDIFDKLDRNRVEQIVELVSDDQFGQIFITDTNREHLDGILRSSKTDHKIFKAIQGEIEEVK